MKSTINPELIITLGAPNDQDGNLSHIALSRLNKALDILKHKPETKLLITGGFGRFNTTSKPHCFYVKKYVLDMGLDENRIIGEIESSHTVDDALLSHHFLSDFVIRNITIVTSSWHIERAKFIFQHFFEPNKLDFVGSSDVVADELKKRLKHEVEQLKILMNQGGVIVNGKLVARVNQ